MSKKIYTKNDVLKMMYNNTSNSFRIIANGAKQRGDSADDIIEWLLECADILKAQVSVIEAREILESK